MRSASGDQEVWVGGGTGSLYDKFDSANRGDALRGEDRHVHPLRLADRCARLWNPRAKSHTAWSTVPRVFRWLSLFVSEVSRRTERSQGRFQIALLASRLQARRLSRDPCPFRAGRRRS